jgi:ankyrin repeat protein
MTWLYTIWDAVSGNIYNLVSKYIKDKSYSVNEPRPGDLKTPLHVAVMSLKLDMIKLLLQLGADPQ